MTIDLKVLADNRDALLLAEVAALLHDWQKCIDMAVATQWCNNPHLALTSKPREWQSRALHLRPGKFAQALSSIPLQLDSNPSIDLKTFCEEGRNPSSAKNHQNPLVYLLGACHAQAHVDKELGEQEQLEQACDRISTAIVRHQSAEANGRHGPFRAHHAGKKTLKGLLGDIEGIRWEFDERDLSRRMIRHRRDAELLPYLFLARVVRLADQRSLLNKVRPQT